MNQRDKRSSIVRSYKLGDIFYNHILFLEEDDRIEVRDQDENIHLTFTANSVVHKGDLKGPVIGNLLLVDLIPQHWMFSPLNGDLKEIHLTSSHSEIILDLEVEVAKAFLSN